jgi:hypothetical protein
LSAPIFVVVDLATGKSGEADKRQDGHDDDDETDDVNDGVHGDDPLFVTQVDHQP